MSNTGFHDSENHGLYGVDVQLVCLISQVRANAMAIVVIHSPADNPPSHIAQLGTNQSLLCEVEQVREKSLSENADPSSWTSLTKYDIKNDGTNLKHVV